MGEHSLYQEQVKLPKLSTSESTPLGKLITDRYQSREFARVKKLVDYLSAFHLKKATTEKVSGRQATINGKPVINFGSANYLGLEQHPEVIESSKEAIDRWGCHAGSSRIFVSQENILKLEKELSQLLGAERSIVGHNLSQTHAGVIPALFGHDDCQIFIDCFAHASMTQASQIARAQGASLKTIDVMNLERTQKWLENSQKTTKVLMIDGVYSMQGHTPELHSLEKICKATNTILYVDDAHGVGVFGKRGGGVFEDADFDNLLVTGSLQKAFGTYGGFISGNKDVIEYLRLTSKAYIFSGTLQPSAVEGARTSVRICQSPEGQFLRERLFSLSDTVRASLTEMGFKVRDARSPIVPVLIGDDIKTLMAGRKLFDQGIYLNSVLHPAVPKNQGILRISLNAVHSDEDIQHLLNSFVTLKDYLKIHQNKWRSYSHVFKEVIKANLLASYYRGL